MKEREVLEVDVLIVGGGPGGLAAAYHLRRLLAAAPVPSGEVAIALLEKAGNLGSHQLSGAVLDPRGLRELVPDYEARGCPIESVVTAEEIFFLTEKKAIRFPFTPPMLRNHGNLLVSLNRFTKWLGELVETSGVDLFPGFSGQELLCEGERVVGVRTGDRGRDRSGQPKSNFEPGVDIKAKVTVLAEGVRGSLTKQAIARFALDAGKDPQVYATGVKEIWELPPGRTDTGRVIHTMGWPLDDRTYGGSFIYHLSGNLLALGFVVGCDWENPLLSPHHVFQQFKQHPLVAKMLDGGKMVGYGAKAIPKGGWYSLPRPYADGLLLVGDAGGYQNAQRLKGVHLAQKTGMLAAEQIHAALQIDDTSSAALAGFEAKVRASWAGQELHACRNFHQGFEGGLYAGMFHTGVQMITGGRGLKDHATVVPDHSHMQTLAARRGRGRSIAAPEWKPDGRLTFDRLTSVFHSGTKHEEDEPCHLVVADTDICRNRCAEEFGNPCQYFCPAYVYEMVPDEERGGRKLQINASNCVHCKTCDIMDPYQIITWVPPQGGEGPVYTNL